jgi:two-component system OmpR family sensor kinase
VTLAERARTSLPLQAGLRSVPLRTKLVASVLVLVFAALALISAASTYALHSYLIGRLDAQLQNVTDTVTRLPGVQVLVPPDYYVALTSVSGVTGTPAAMVSSISPSQLPPLARGIDQVNAKAGKPYTVRSVDGTAHWRMLVTYVDEGQVLHVAQRLQGIDLAIGRLVWVDTLVGAGVLIALAAVGAALVRQTLIPLGQIERTAAAIAAGDLTQRVPDPEPDVEHPRTELGRLSRALNAMLAQIEAAFTARAQSETAARAAESAARDAAQAAQVSESRAVRSEQKMRQFVADASHELRTPLTTIRGYAELAGRTPDVLPTSMAKVSEEAERMSSLVEDLLLLARLDSGRPLATEPVDLTALLVSAVDDARVVDRSRTWALTLPPEPVVVDGDEQRLHQVVTNLLGNARRHTSPGTSVTAGISRANGRVLLTVHDTGPGVPEGIDVFERFTRGDSSRTRSSGGAGLGLSLVAAIAGAHGGEVSLESRPGDTTFTVALPA